MYFIHHDKRECKFKEYLSISQISKEHTYTLGRKIEALYEGQQILQYCERERGNKTSD